MEKKDVKPFGLFRRCAKGRGREITGLTSAYAVSVALLVLAPRALSLFIDSVHAGNGAYAVLLAIALYFAAMAAQSAVSAVFEYRLSAVGLLMTDAHRREIMSHYLSLSAGSLSGFTSGEIITRLNEDAPGLFRYYYILFYKLAGSAFALAGILVSIYVSAGPASLAFLLVSLLAVLGFKAIQDRGIPKYVKSSEASAGFNGLVMETLENSQTLRALNAEGYANKKVLSAMKERYRKSFPASLMYANLWSASTAMQAAVVVLGLVLALFLRDLGSISLGTAYMIFTYCELIITPLQDFRNHMGELQGARAGVLRSMEFLSMPVEAVGGDAALREGAIELAVEDVRFAYGDGGDVLKGIGFALPAGGRLGIAGETGCGKSTLLGLIARMNPLSRGAVKLNGVDAADINIFVFRERVAYLTQRTQLMHGTIRDNVTFFDERHSDEKIWEAARSLGLEGWLRGRGGLESLLELGEGSLSSGEAQLLSLIRLMLRRPGLVLLDEITSNLDAAAEGRVIAAVTAMCEGRTVISIAHNPASLNWMENVAKMDGGVLRMPAVRAEASV